MATATRALVPQKLSVRDFSGGPNVRDAQPELGQNEESDAWNVTFDERGGVAARLGYVKVNGSPYGGGVVKNVWYSPTLSDYVTQAGASLYLGTGTTIRKTFSTSARVGFADFVGKLCVIHPVDGIFTSTDGITYTAVADADAPKGSCLYVFQNKLFAAGDPTNLSRVAWSATADPATWSATDYNDLREKDSEQVVALAGASGVDVALGRVGLLAFKRRSAYRIYDSASGAYMTIDQRVGAASSVACAVSNGRVFTISEYGIYWTDGLTPMTPASELLEPLWSQAQVALQQIDLWCAGAHRNRLYFSLCRAGSSANDLALELHPDQGWIAPGSNAASAYANYANQTDKLYAGSPTVTGQVYEMGTGGTDDGAAIDSRLQTRWYELAAGAQFNMFHGTLRGYGSFHASFRSDFRSDDQAAYDIVLTDGTTALLYDTGLQYDSGLLYGAPTTEATTDVYPVVIGKAVGFRITASTTGSSNLPALFAVGDGPEVGGWRLYGLDLEFIDQSFA